MFEIAVFGRVVAFVEWYSRHCVRRQIWRWCERAGIRDSWTFRGRMPSTMQEHMEVARVFLRIPESEPDEEEEAQ